MGRGASTAAPVTSVVVMVVAWALVRLLACGVEAAAGEAAAVELGGDGSLSINSTGDIRFVPGQEDTGMHGTVLLRVGKVDIITTLRHLSQSMAELREAAVPAAPHIPLGDAWPWNTTTTTACAPSSVNDSGGGAALALEENGTLNIFAEGGGVQLSNGPGSTTFVGGMDVVDALNNVSCTINATHVAAQAAGLLPSSNAGGSLGPSSEHACPLVWDMQSLQDEAFIWVDNSTQSLHLGAPRHVKLNPGVGATVSACDGDLVAAIRNLKSAAFHLQEAVQERTQCKAASKTLNCSSDASRQEIASLNVCEVESVVECCCALVPTLRRVNGDVHVSSSTTALAFGSIVEVQGSIFVAGSASSPGKLESIDFGRLARLHSVVDAAHNPLVSITFGALTRTGPLLLGNSLLTSLALGTVRSMDGGISFINSPRLTTVDFGRLTQVGGPIAGSDCALQSVDFGSITACSGIELSSNALTSVEFGSLEYIAGSLLLLNNDLTNINFAGITSVAGRLALSNNHLSSIDFGRLAFVGADIELEGNLLTSVSLGRLTRVGGDVYLSSVGLTSFDFGRLSAWSGALYLANNALASISFGNITAWEGTADLSSNRLTSIAFGRITSWDGSALLQGNVLTSIDFANLTSAYGRSDFSDNHITSVDLRHVTSVSNLKLNSNNITSINFRNLTTVGQLDLSENRLVSIHFSASAGSVAADLYLSSNALTSVDFGGLTLVRGNLHLDNNNLTSIGFHATDVRGFIDLRNNSLTAVDCHNAGACICLDQYVQATNCRPPWGWC